MRSGGLVSTGYNNADELCWSGPTTGGNGTTNCPATPTGDTPYSYDATGNQTSGGLSFAYNTKNQTTSTTNAGTTSTFGYTDSTQTERTTSTTNGTATTLLNGLEGLSGQTVGTTTPTYFTRDPQGTLISLRVGAGGTSTNSYYLLDQQGSVLRLTDSTDSTGLTDTATYDPYGTTLTTTGTQTTTNPYRYATSYYDVSTGLNKLGLRYYNPAIGRFTQPDPSGQESNTYAYARGCPSTFDDPNGTSARCAVAGVAGGVLGAFVGGGIGLFVGGPAGAVVGGSFAAGAGAGAVGGACGSSSRNPADRARSAATEGATFGLGGIVIAAAQSVIH